MARTLTASRRVAGRWLALVAMLFAASTAYAQALPTLTQPVTDLANAIDEQSATALERRIRALQTTTGDAVVVVTVPTFAPYGSVEEYAARLFQQAGIGQKGKDNGVLVVLAMQERRVKIEVGYGLEEFVPDGFAGETIREFMLPAFRAGQYGQGLLDGTTRIIQRIADRRGVTLQDVPAVSTRDRPAGQRTGGPPVVLIVIILFIIFSFLNRRRGPPSVRRGPWIGPTWSGWSGGGGGFGGGFGGGSSGGGGASGSW